MKQILTGIHLLKLGSVNAYLVDHGDLTLIDTGYPGSAEKILGYIGSMGRQPADVKNIILTHVHTDHAGSAAALKKATGAAVWMHPADAALAAQGISARPGMKVAPGLPNKIIYYLLIKNAPKTIEPVQADHLINDGDELPLGKGFKAIHTPGHCKGQVALLYGDLLIAADTCINGMGPGLSPANEDELQCYADLKKVAALNFEAAVFGHGSPILKGASSKFRAKWA